MYIKIIKLKKNKCEFFKKNVTIPESLKYLDQKRN